jgi:hypothetical protein
MKLKKTYTRLKRMDKSDDSYVKDSPSNRISMMWEITSEIWSLRKNKYVKRRLQRNITNLIKT